MRAYLGAWTLLKKELQRFWRVVFQTIAAPVITALLYLLVFSHVLADKLQVYTDVPYVAFLIPGLIMMSVLQNAFANSSSSLIQSKIMGNIVFILLTPLSAWEILGVHLIAATVRGALVGVCIYVVAIFFVTLPIAHPGVALLFLLLGSALLGAWGVIAGIWAERFDQMAVFQNFIIVPLSFLAGVFYSIHSLPVFWQKVSKINPFFYMVDGFRYGFFGQADVSPWLSLGVVIVFFIGSAYMALNLLKSGYKIRN